MISITVALSAVILVSVIGFSANTPEFAGAAVDVESTTPGVVSIQLVDSGAADRILVFCGDGVPMEFTSIGEQKELVGPTCDELIVVAEKGTTEQLIQRIELDVAAPAPPLLVPEAGGGADIVIAKDGSGDALTLVEGLAQAQPGDTVRLKNAGDARYEGSASITTPITLTADPGVVLTVPLNETLRVSVAGATIDGVAFEGETGGWGTAVVTVQDGATLTNVGISTNDGPGLNVESPSGTVTLESVSVTSTRGVTIYDSADVDISSLSVTYADTALSVTDSTVTLSASTLDGTYIGVVSSGTNDLLLTDASITGGNRSLYLTASHDGTTTVTDSTLEAVDDEVIRLGFYSTFYGSWQRAGGSLTVDQTEFVDNGVPVATVAFNGSSVDLTDNWWGQPTGPTGGDITGPDTGTVGTSPWCTDHSCTTTSN